MDRKEIINLITVFLIITLIIRAVFYKDTMMHVAAMAFSIYWIFILPGYFVLTYWHKNLTFLERVSVGAAVGSGILGISSYFLGLFGLNINYHHIFLPLILIVVGYMLGRIRQIS